MNFICEPCKNAGLVKTKDDNITLIQKASAHRNCRGGTWCDCQHRVGRKNTSAGN